MKANQLTPGDIILWDGRRQIVEGVYIDQFFKQVNIKLSDHSLINIWRGEMEVLLISHFTPPIIESETK